MSLPAEIVLVATVSWKWRLSLKPRRPWSSSTERRLMVEQSMLSLPALVPNQVENLMKEGKEVKEDVGDAVDVVADVVVAVDVDVDVVVVVVDEVAVVVLLKMNLMQMKVPKKRTKRAILHADPIDPISKGERIVNNLPILFSLQTFRLP